MHNIGTVPTYKTHNVGTVPTFKMHNVGTVHENEDDPKMKTTEKIKTT